MAPALMVGWIAGGAGFFLFGVIAWRRRRATGSIAAGTWCVDLRWGGSMSSSLSRFSGWRSRSLSLGEGLTDSTGARDGTRADGGLDRGRRRVELPGRSRPAPGVSTFAGVDQCRALSPDFQAGARGLYPLARG